MIIRKKRLPDRSPTFPRSEPPASSSTRRGGFQALLFTLLLVIAGPLALAAEPGKGNIDHGGYSLSLNGKSIAGHRRDDLFVPASTIKLLTALAVFRHLGEDYRFTTDFLLGPGRTLHIRGSGDPFLTSEALAEVAMRLKAKGIDQLGGLVLDDAAFQLEHDLPDGSLNSVNPYDTGNGALAVNFNTIAFRKDPDGTIHPLEPQTPVLPISEEIGAHLGPGDYRLNTTAFPVQGDLTAPLRATGELIAAVLGQHGIQVEPVISHGLTPAEALAITSLTSAKTSWEMVRDCLHFSNNYIANQLALTAGAVRFGYPASWAKARQTLREMATQLGIPETAMEIIEGSGLSRDNRLSPAAMLKIVAAFAPWRDLLPEKQGALLKSGTMEGIFCYAGYVELPTGTAQLVIMLNQQDNRRDAILTTMLTTLNRTITADTRP